MTTVTLRGSEIKSEADLHETLAACLDFGPYYGNNLAALWDRLSADVPRPLTIVWENASESRRHLGVEEFDQVVLLFEDVRRQDEDAGLANGFTYRILA